MAENEASAKVDRAVLLSQIRKYLIPTPTVLAYTKPDTRADLKREYNSRKHRLLYLELTNLTRRVDCAKSDWGQAKE